MVSINGTDMTWYGSCQGVEGQKKCGIWEESKKEIGAPQKLPITYITRISKAILLSYALRRPSILHGPYCQASVALNYLERTLIGLLSLLDNLYGIVNDFGLNHKLRNTAESYQERTNNPRVLERICTCHFLGKGNCSSVWREIWAFCNHLSWAWSSVTYFCLLMTRTLIIEQAKKFRRFKKWIEAVSCCWWRM